MEFNKAYNRKDFVNFVRTEFLPEDYLEDIKVQTIDGTLKYSKTITKIGDCKSLALDVFEIKHSSSNDARVSLSKESFRILSQCSWNDRALIAFVPEDNPANYRISLVCIERKWDGDKKTKEFSNPRRYSYYLGEGIGTHTPDKYLKASGRVTDFKDLQNRFSVEVLTTQFYNELYNWYQWAVNERSSITFPNNPNTSADDKENLNVKIIRMITRILFVWFIKQKGLVPLSIFDENKLKGILKDFNPTDKKKGNYYNAILQNLFFATINRPIIDEDGKSRRFAKNKDKRDLRNLYRYADLFNISEKEVVNLFDKVPFLNGGLFECLDKFKKIDILKDDDRYIDGFSRNYTKSANGNFRYIAFVPNIYFFNTDENQLGFIKILERYNFTVEENSLSDVQVSLDPELLGRVFENLLAAYNPETQESARKSTGSYYTPREIVSYMVDEALVTHILHKCHNVAKQDIRLFFSTHIIPSDWNKEVCDAIIKSMESIKILDPACGSGAFPMGLLLRIVEIIELLHNGVIDRYALKLKIIENCIYGVDIQPIAIMISKLRFFISLICEQNDIDFNNKENNYGIHTLPNLETKFVSANSLISADIHQFADDWTKDSVLDKLKNELLQIRKNHFLARSQYQKIKYREADEQKRDEILNLIIEHSTKPNKTLIANFYGQIESYQKEITSYQGEYVIEEWIQPEDTLFGTQKPTLFRHDINKEKRDELNHKIAICKENIYKEENKSILQGFEAAVEQVTLWNPYDQNATFPFFDPEWMFGVSDGFDIVIGNPPYISTKGVTSEDKKSYMKEFGFSDDTYNHFFFKGFSLLNNNGVLTYITPKTFWTTQTKRNLRDKLLSNTINYIFDTANPFKAAMVDTCITSVIKKENDNNSIVFLDGSKDLLNPLRYKVNQGIYVNAQNSVIFKPTPENMKIYKLYGEKVRELYNEWWDKIKTSRDIAQNEEKLKAYRESLKPGDIALLGCLTEGGQGLATANNGKYIAVRKSTKWAKNILESRPKKLAEAAKKNKIKAEWVGNEVNYLSQSTESQIAELFDKLKVKYGRDIFGQGYIFRLIDDSEMADVEQLTDDEKENGIDKSKNIYVPYDKGDKDGNRWYLETPFAIAWSKENVHFLKTDPKARYQGYTFFFKEGFAWSAVNGTRSSNELKFRYKGKSVNDVQGMSLSSVSNLVSAKYIVCICNSDFSNRYTESFINSTVIFQINDARQMAIIVPTKGQSTQFENLYDEAYQIKQNQFVGKISTSDADKSLKDIQERLNNMVDKLYFI